MDRTGTELTIVGEYLLYIERERATAGIAPLPPLHLLLPLELNSVSLLLGFYGYLLGLSLLAHWFYFHLYIFSFGTLTRLSWLVFSSPMDIIKSIFSRIKGIIILLLHLAKFHIYSQFTCILYKYLASIFKIFAKWWNSKVAIWGRLAHNFFSFVKIENIATMFRI